MAVHGEGDIFRTCPEFNRQNAFGNHVRRAGADNMNPQDTIRFAVSDHFDHTLGFAQSARPADDGKRVSADTVRNIAFF